jgi:acylpyruvate hydrolase
MRFVSYRDAAAPDGTAWGIVVGESVAPAAALGLPATLAGWMAGGGAPNAALAQAAANAAPRLPLATLDLAPVIPRPGKIVCLGVNYIDHAKEGGNRVGDYPALFLRAATSLLAHGAPLVRPPVSDKLDYEAELALVIGRSARHVAEADALAHVFGYSAFNDATLRDYQRRTTQWTIGKNFDATGAFGPWLVSADELPPGAAGLHIESRLNGRVMQSANTSQMVFGVARTVALLSECLTLEPGDVVVMGTPSGVGYARTPPVWMKPGDTIEVEIERIGTLRNRVAA